MNAPPPAQKTRDAGTPTTLATQPTQMPVIASILGLISLAVLFLFHLGAAYLSYQKFGNIAWAVVDFIFAYFYYPYYAFFLANTPVASAPMTPTAMVGGMMKALSGARRR